MVKKNIRIIIVDDHELVRKGLLSIFEHVEDFDVVKETDSGFEAVNETIKLKPDILLLDLRLPDINGIKVTELVKEKFPACKIIILSTYNLEEEVLQSIKAGISGYVLKGIEPNELIEIIRTVAKGGSYLNPEATTQVMNEFLNNAEEDHNKISNLTKREKEILNHVAIGLRNKEIADRLFISEKTVKTHLSNILTKLKKTDRTAAVIYAMQEGIITLENQQEMNI